MYNIHIGLWYGSMDFVILVNIHGTMMCESTNIWINVMISNSTSYVHTLYPRFEVLMWSMEQRSMRIHIICICGTIEYKWDNTGIWWKNDENGLWGVWKSTTKSTGLSSCSLPQMAVSGYTLFLGTPIYMFVQILYHMSIFRIYSQT